ncbi:unnamed protein product, partial [Citrullus colocynthis]
SVDIVPMEKNQLKSIDGPILEPNCGPENTLHVNAPYFKPILGGRFGTKYGAILVVISAYKEMICSVLGAKASAVYEGLKMAKK